MLSKLLIKPRATRELLRIQRKQKVLEPNIAKGYDSGPSSENEDNLTVSAQKQFKQLVMLREMLAKDDYKIETSDLLDDDQKELIAGAL